MKFMKRKLILISEYHVRFFNYLLFMIVQTNIMVSLFILEQHCDKHIVPDNEYEDSSDEESIYNSTIPVEYGPSKYVRSYRHKIIKNRSQKNLLSRLDPKVKYPDIIYPQNNNNGQFSME